ncbi:hypothetical protein SNEBB_005207 [Seison nebaliae]|nr:hypothetical protein SNEBB_005207 [Seison nebaliae]
MRRKDTLMMTFVLAISLDWKTDDNMEKQKCENMTPYFMKQKLFNGVPINYIRNFYKVIGKTDLWSIFPMLFYLSRPFRTYEESWYPFYLFLYKRIHTEIKHAGVIEEKDQILKKSPEPIPEFPIRFEQDSADEPIEFTTLGNVLESEKTDMKEKSLEERELKFPDFTNLNLDDRIFSEKDDAAPEALRVSIMQAMQTSVIHPRNIKRKEKKKPDIEEEELIEKEEWEEV